VKIAIMQPYLFPYIGYFQLIHAVDRFIVYDDVTFIKQGWINRNRILVNGEPLLFSVPLSGASSNKLIRDIQINNAPYIVWRKKFFKTLEQNYRKAPQYEKILSIMKDVFGDEPQLISILAIRSIKVTCAYLDITTGILETAINYSNSHLKAEDRVIDICCKEHAQTYVNAAGGRELYNKDNFKRNGIDLYFLKSKYISYKQLEYPFIPWLSIIDVMMFNSKETIKTFLLQFILEE